MFSMASIHGVAYIASLVLGFVSLCVFLKFRCRKACGQATVSKAVVSTFFILSWLVLYSSNTVNYGMFLGAGLVCGLLGDVFLDLKFCNSEYEDFYTYSGFLAFAVGHFFYIGAVITGVKGEFRPIAFLPAAGVGVVVALVVFFGEKVMGLHYGKYKVISTLYGALLFFMASFALFTAVFCGIKENMHLVAMFAGGVLFAVSDLILSGTYFGEGKNRPVDIITNHVTYYLAQYVIAASLILA